MKPGSATSTTTSASASATSVRGPPLHPHGHPEMFSSNTTKPVEVPVSAAIRFGSNVSAAKKPLKEKLVAHSAPSPFRPPPPKAPSARPRVPTIDPPPMELPPSPLFEAPIALESRNTSEEPAVESKTKGKRGRSLTQGHAALYSTSAPNISYLANAKFSPSFVAQLETAYEEAKKSAEDDKKRARVDSSIAPPTEDILAKSPTIFSMLKLDSDVRRKNSMAPGAGEDDLEEKDASASASEPNIEEEPTSDDGAPPDDLQFELDNEDGDGEAEPEAESGHRSKASSNKKSDILLFNVN